MTNTTTTQTRNAIRPGKYDGKLPEELAELALFNFSKLSLLRIDNEETLQCEKVARHDARIEREKSAEAVLEVLRETEGFLSQPPTMPPTLGTNEIL